MYMISKESTQVTYNSLGIYKKYGVASKHVNTMLFIEQSEEQQVLYQGQTNDSLYMVIYT